MVWFYAILLMAGRVSRRVFSTVVTFCGISGVSEGKRPTEYASNYFFL